LSADGTLYTCLFATAGHSLLAPIRNGASDDELAEILQQVWLQRKDRYSELREPVAAERPLVSKVEMYRMGG
jgi:cyclic pyranopterin phosphate synthase